ncbi:MAG: hypothetical protein RMZ69_30635 [Nostoc sp. ChiQUE01a]|nr:hypothetical protein [Nostoc sp. DedQUE11]MDZ8073322.1 hypothetical protein [Nostoc sp. DedQUE01]MDZ8241467.1 hypothetical protein [Nostoc sp. ChiQUE01a]
MRLDGSVTCYQRAIPLGIVPGTGLFIGDQFTLDKSDRYYLWI